MNFRDFRGIIFDLDGTLIDSAHVWTDIDEKFLARRGITVPKDYCKAVSTMHFKAAAVYTNDIFGLNENPDDIVAEWYNMAIDEYSHNIFLKDGAENFLKKVKAIGIKIALATASARELYEAVLKNNGVFELFDFFASTDRVVRGKGFPDVYELACGELGLKPGDCAVFEDIIEGVLGAKAGGFTAVACLEGHFLGDCEKMKQEADFWFDSYNDIII